MNSSKEHLEREGETELAAYEHFFRAPKLGDKVLKPGVSGTACANTRTDLRVVNHHVEFRNAYDEELRYAQLTTYTVALDIPIFHHKRCVACAMGT